MLTKIRALRSEIAAWNEASASARPGEVWTSTYVGKDRTGEPFTEIESGRARFLGEECPVEECRGQLCVGETTLGDQRGFLREAIVGRSGTFTLTRGCDALDRHVSRPPNAGPSDFWTAPSRNWIAVEYAQPHPVYNGIRFFAAGVAGHADEDGRTIGGSFINRDVDIRYVRIGGDP